MKASGNLDAADGSQRAFGFAAMFFPTGRENQFTVAEFEGSDPARREISG